jgi:hypothetical protein
MISTANLFSSIVLLILCCGVEILYIFYLFEEERVYIRRLDEL